MSDDLQFEKAEYSEGPQCASCSKALGSPFWQAGSVRVCAACKEAISAHLGAPVTIGGQVKAAAAGFAVVLAGAAAWAGIAAATGYELGIVAIAVGWAIAEVMRRVAGQGSRLLQVVGVFFVYLTVSCASIPSFLEASEGGGVIAWIVAVPLAFALPFLVWTQGVSALLWYIIVFFGMNRAWSGLAPTRVEFQGPFTA